MFSTLEGVFLAKSKKWLKSQENAVFEVCGFFGIKISVKLRAFSVFLCETEKNLDCFTLFAMTGRN
jgi:hypothetical protein